MTTPCRSLLPALALGTLVAAPVLAQTPATGIDDALRIARANGIATITKIEMDDGKWEVEGRNAAQQRIEIDIDPASGKILKTETD